MRRFLSTTLAVAALVAPVRGAEAVLPVPSAAADALVAEAEAAVATGAWQRAEALYREALAVAGEHAGARSGLARVEAIQQGVGDRGGVDLAAVQQQVRVVEARAAAERAELLARQGRHVAARQALEQARGTLVGIEAVQELSADLVRIDRLITEIEPRVDDAATHAAVAERTAALAAAEAASGDQRQRRASALAERIERIKGLQQRLMFELALAEARALVREVPGDVEAEALYEDLLAAVHRQRATDLDEQRETRLRETHRRIEEALLPTGWDARPNYPENWLQRQRDNLTFAGESTQPEPWEEQLVDSLSQRVTLVFDEAPIDEALALLAQQGQFNLVVDPSVYATGAVPISLRVTDMRIDHVLNWLAQMTNQTWVLNLGAVYFGGETEQNRVLAVYDLAFLVRVPYDQPGYSIAFSAGGGGDGGGFSLFAEDDTATEQLAPEDIVDLIRSAVSPSAWEDPANAIEIRGNQLYVTASRREHLLLQEFFRSQANSRSLAVHIAARWVTIQDNALEEIGVNWGSAATLITPGGGVPPPGAMHQNSTSAWTASAVNRLPTGATPIQPATDGTGLNLSMLRLGSTQFAAVLTAVERKSQGRTLARPELTTLNGVRGSVFVGQQYAYIADYEVVNNNLDPVIEVLTIGAGLDIKPYVSADRKLVTMEFRPSIATVSFFTELITAPRVIANGDNGGGVVIPDLAYPIELPNVELDSVSTTIMVPDGGSLMVGGFNTTIDESASAKVPFLGHIPFLGRLFGTRGRYHQRERLFLLANVRIIDYQEAEDRL